MAKQWNKRKIAMVTGAAGGIGQACARLLGHDHRLVLSDITAEGLETFGDQLRGDGYEIVACITGDLSHPGIADDLKQAACSNGELTCVVHTAGLSPALADWRAIIMTNLVATEHLLRAVEHDQSAGLTAVLIASMAGHLAPSAPEFDDLFADLLRPDLLQALAGPISRSASDDSEHARARTAYAQSKRAVLKMAERRAAPWGVWGGRIVSVSPGITATPMGRKEAEDNPYALHTLRSTPAGRWGSPLDVAGAVNFLVSEHASFITGTDIRVDGGVTPVLANRQGLEFLPKGR